MRLAVIALLMTGGVSAQFAIGDIFNSIILDAIGYETLHGSLFSQATADANAGGVQTNPLVCEDDSTALDAKWNEPPNSIHSWCSYSYSWNGEAASGSAFQGLELTDFKPVTSELTGTSAESILDVASDPNEPFLKSICKQREGGIVQDGHFKSASTFLEGKGPSTKWGKKGRMNLVSIEAIISVDIALHESPSIAQGLIVSTRVVWNKDGIISFGEDVRIKFDRVHRFPQWLLEQTKAFTATQIGKQLHTGSGMHVAEVARKYEDGVEGVVGAAFTMWFAVTPSSADLEDGAFAFVTGRNTCKESCPDLATGADAFKVKDASSGALSTTSGDSTCSTVLSDDAWTVKTKDVEYTNPNDKWLALCTSINTRPTTLTHGGVTYDGSSAECCKACAETAPPCVFHSNDKHACMKDTACDWTDPTDGGTNCASAYSDSVACTALGGGCSIDSTTGMCTGGSSRATCQPASGSGSGILARRARSDELELKLDGSEGAKRARRYDSSSSTAVGSASDPSATSTWVWTQATLMPPVCSGLLGIAGVTDASYDNPGATTPCTKGCGGMVKPRNSHAMNELNWLMGVVLAIVAFLQIGSMAMSGDGGEPTKLANLIIAVIAAHVIVGLWLMWDDGMSCTEYLVEFSGEPQQVMSRLAWHWPHVITTQGIMWPYIIGILLAAIVGALALIGLLSKKRFALPGSAAFQAVAMIAPLLTLVTMEIFVAVGTYGAMTAGRSEGPDEKMNFWVAEAFAKMGGEAVERNTSLAVGGWLVVVAFMVVSVGTTVIAAYAYGLRGMVSDPAGMPATAVLQAFLFPGAVMLATEAYAAAKHADRVWHGPNDSYMVTSDVLDFCASTSWIDTTVTEAGMVALYVFALAMPVALGLALLTLIATRGDGSPTSAAARMVALVATAGTVALTVYMFMWQKLGHCLTVPITPGFAYFAPFFTTVGVTVLAITATAIVAGIGDAPPAYTAKMPTSYAGYFGATKSTSFM